MTAHQDDAVVLWTNMPSFHLIGPFVQLAQRRKVYCVCREPTSKFRGEMKWKIPEFGALDVRYLNEQDDQKRFVDQIVDQTRDATHFVSGFGNQPGTKLFWERAQQLRIKPIMIAERPNPQRNPFKALARDVLYRRKIRSIADEIAAVLCIGSLSVDAYKRYGLPERKTLQFMYTSASPFPELPEKITIGSPLRFVYVGRDDPWIKGLDLLTEALKSFTSEQLTFDFIGPPLDSQLVQFARENRLDGVMRFLGSLPNDEVARKLATEYDVLVLAGRYDGWGMTISEALLSGIGAIASDAVGAKDVALASGAGLVVKSGSVGALRSAIRGLVERPETAREWKERARTYREKLRTEKLADYLEEVVAYVARGSQGVKPRPHWL